MDTEKNKNREKLKLIDKGVDRVDKILDIEQIKASQERLKVLIHLLLSPYERKLIRAVHHQTVLKGHKESF